MLRPQTLLLRRFKDTTFTIGKTRYTINENLVSRLSRQELDMVYRLLDTGLSITRAEFLAEFDVDHDKKFYNSMVKNLQKEVKQITGWLKDLDFESKY